MKKNKKKYLDPLKPRFSNSKIVTGRGSMVNLRKGELDDFF